MKTITYVANLIDYKGHMDLLEAWKLVLASTDPGQLRLWLIGKDRGEKIKLMAKIHAEDIPGITFWGYQADVGPMLQKTTIYVHPSREEGCSNAILEAMTYGLPVVATEAGGNPELVKHGQTGLLVPVGNATALAEAIVKLLNDPATCKRYGVRAMLRVRQLFKREDMVRKYGDFYVRLCGDGQFRPTGSAAS